MKRTLAIATLLAVSLPALSGVWVLDVGDHKNPCKEIDHSNVGLAGVEYITKFDNRMETIYALQKAPSGDEFFIGYSRKYDKPISIASTQGMCMRIYNESKKGTFREMADNPVAPKSFRCPEQLPSNAARTEEANAYIDWAVSKYGNMSEKQLISLRAKALDRNNCGKQN